MPNSDAEPEWLMQRRKEAERLFHKHPQPQFKHGISIRLDMHEFSFGQVSMSSPHERASKAKACLGRNSPGVLDLDQALEQQVQVKDHLFSLLTPQDKQSSFHLMHAGIKILHARKGAEMREPVTITTRTAGSTAEHLLVIAEPESRISIIEVIEPEDTTRNVGSDATGTGGLLYLSSGVEIVAMDGAKVSYTCVQQLPEHAYCFLFRRARVMRSAEVQWNEYAFGGKASIISTSTDLQEGSGAENTGMFFATGSQQVELGMQTTHSAPRTRSHMQVKGAVDDHAKSVYSGLIHIRNNAADSEGFQESRMLMLSDGCEADAIPTLQIDNPDVKCSHAAAISHIDSEELFYMMSRGIAEGEAKKLIIGGFFMPIVEKLEVPELRERVITAVSRKIHRKILQDAGTAP